MHGSSHGKQAITHRSRKLHFLTWCHDVGLPDPCTPALPLQGRNWIITCYTVSLIQGKTIKGIRIRHATLQGYVSQALSLHIDRGLINPILADINYINIMTNVIKKYETLPNRKEMISDSMFNYIATLHKRATDDSFVHAVIDWITLSCYTGFRKSEWCSDHPVFFATIDDPHWGNRPTALPVIASDFAFTTESGRWLHDPVSSPDHKVEFTSLCFQKQKNNDNGQILTYRRRSDAHWMCPVQASLNIVQCA